MQTPLDRALEQMERATASLQGARERIAELEDALRWTLPMAKGYAAAHRVGDNEGKVAHAERILTNPGDN